jgi:catalase
MDDLGGRLVDASLRPFPDHVEGTRPAHAKGVGATGCFQPSEVALRYCRAELFAHEVPVTVRFSNASGTPAPDHRADVRGMAVKFGLSGPGVGPLDEHTEQADLIAITVPVVPFRTVDDFLAFSAAAVPAPVRPVPLVERVLAKLALREAPPAPVEPMSVEQGLFWFGVTNPALLAGMLAVGTTITPVSYARATYHAVHAFRVTGSDGTVRFVRFHWDPAAGVRPLAQTDVVPDDYLAAELHRRLTDGPVEFALRAQVADTGDDTTDPSRPWPLRRRFLDLGRLALTAPLDAAATEALSFNPTRLVDGIAASDDPILAARGQAYPVSFERRAKGPCPFAAEPQ